VKSEWVRAEADMARHHRKLVQTAIDDVMPPLPVNQIQDVEIGDRRGEADHFGWRKVKTSLAELCGRTASNLAPLRPIPSAPPPRSKTPAPRIRAARWPLFAGLGVGAVGLAVAGGALLGQRGNAPTPVAPQTVATPAVIASASAQVAVPPVSAPAGEPAGVIHVVVAGAPVASSSPAPAAVTAPGTADDEPLPFPADMTFPERSARLLQPSELSPLGPGAAEGRGRT
jgi:hypothetical protein